MATFQATALPPRLSIALLRTQALAAALVSRPIVWALFVGTMFALPLAKAFTRELPLPPPVLSDLPAFTLTQEGGTAFGSEMLRGHVWVAEFGRYGQDSEREARTDRLLHIQHRMRNMGETGRIVSVSVDPERDTPTQLRNYATEHNANPYMWVFLTGETAPLHEALSAGLRAHVSGLLPTSTVADSGYLVLVDPDLRVRGYYPPTADGVDRLVLDMGLIANLYEPKPSAMAVRASS